MSRLRTHWLLASTLAFYFGCGTTTQKFATEQLLISDAVDQAVADIDFSFLAGEKVFMDINYLNAVKGSGFANIDYIVSALREQMSTAGCLVQDNREDARIIIEPRVGALGTDGHEITYGIPQTGQISTAAAAFSNSPIMPTIPEISFGKSDKQLGIAKIMLFAYDRESKVAVWQSGRQQSESTSTNTWVLGAGPIQRGTIHDGFRFAGKNLRGGNLEADSDPRVLSQIESSTAPGPEQEPAEKVASENTPESGDESSIMR